jgi:predicted metalloprotease with PDZ domain
MNIHRFHSRRTTGAVPAAAFDSALRPEKPGDLATPVAKQESPTKCVFTSYSPATPRHARPASTTRVFCSLLALLWIEGSSQARLDAAEILKLEVDATRVGQRLLQSHMVIPAAPGPMVLQYPKWIPGEHGPSGPVTDLTGVQLKAAGQEVPWRRDALDPFVFHLEVPAGVRELEVSLEYLLPNTPGNFAHAASSSANLMVLNWNQVLLYPKGLPDDARVQPRLRLPEGWKSASALELSSEESAIQAFAPVSLETLIDSPLVAGRHLRSFDLSPGESIPHRLNVVADSAAALELDPRDLEHYQKLVEEAHALFGSRHYRKYDFLLTLSDQVPPFGLEHHECSDDRLPERALIDRACFEASASLLPHELVHSWNGKFRRPAALATTDPHQPMKSELLWVYEGLTTYLAQVLATRSGLWSTTNYLGYLGLSAAQLDHQRGRDWRPLVDTADAAHLLYGARPEGASRRRSVDFYAEGELIWLEADVVIRQATHGQRSLDDFCRQFFGGGTTGPSVSTYTLDDVVAALNEVAPRDWRGFFQDRVYRVNRRVPLGGIEGGGWRLVYEAEPTEWFKSFETIQERTELSFSLGFALAKDGAILDTIPGSPVDKAGLFPGAKLLAVDDRRATPDLLKSAILRAQNDGAPIRLLIENGDVFQTCELGYAGGERYPRLQRDAATTDLLADILAPKAAK